MAPPGSTDMPPLSRERAKALLRAYLTWQARWVVRPFVLLTAWLLLAGAVQIVVLNVYDQAGALAAAWASVVTCGSGGVVLGLGSKEAWRFLDA